MGQEMTLAQMIGGLKTVSEEAWGMYAFSRDPLRDKISEERKREMIGKAIACGREKARWAIERFGTRDPARMAGQMGLQVISRDKGQIADRLLFALFTPPNQVEIMEEPLQKAEGLSYGLDGVDAGNMRRLILGHEIYHFLEEEDEEIYTRREKIELWKFLGFRNRSTVRALSEIAGMYFSQSLTQFCCSPFALDVILYYGYDVQVAEGLYREIMGFQQAYPMRKGLDAPSI